ncbi:hypothetical protein L5515_013879 [Caenorhabditis briggsae]|uniref:Uncharacterized protein n=1 Tax=Caenorhabditis briggsae TaxID=6238 RepID=A0AAE9J748_CAEBR|nr:hypothetical protein L5515_013879 [Caenorhabditis briggsae]
MSTPRDFGPRLVGKAHAPMKVKNNLPNDISCDQLPEPNSLDVTCRYLAALDEDEGRFERKSFRSGDRGGPSFFAVT